MLAIRLRSLLALALICAAPLSAQSGDRSKTTGFVIGTGLDVTAVDPEDRGSAGGAGLFLKLGAGITPHFGLHSSLSFSGLEDDRAIAAADLLARFQFLAGRSIAVPYVGVGPAVTVQSTELLDPWAAFGVSAATGVQIHPTRRFAIDLGLHVTRDLAVGSTSFDAEFFGEETEFTPAAATIARLRIGATWFIGR